MIQYEGKNYSGVVFRIRGTVLVGLLPRILLTAGMGGLAAWGFATHGFKIPSIAHTLLGVALGLLLVFRTNASYDRFWEGRKLFGSFINRSRDLARQASVYFGGDDEGAAELRSELHRRTVLFFALLRQYLRAERELEAVEKWSTEEERALLEPLQVRPVLAAKWLTECIARARREERISDLQLFGMDQNVTALVDNWGGMERIMRTPIPLAYAHHIKAFLGLFCLSVPFAMVETMKWFTPLAAGVLGFAMFGIEEIGVEIEDPFGYDPNDLPLDGFEQRIDTDMRVLLKE